MAQDGNIDKLKDARDKCAEVYEAEAIDELVDNGNLGNLNAAILSINNAIQVIGKRPN